MAKSLTIEGAEVLPPEEDGTYTVQYLFDDGSWGVEPGLTKEKAEERIHYVGDKVEIAQLH
jgi:hypothetical protein